MTTPTPPTDRLTRITDARPTDADLATTWPAAERAALLDRIRAEAAEGHGSKRPRRPRRPTAWLAAAAVIATITVVPPVLDSGDAQARTEILDLAARVAEAEPLDFRPGTFLHVRTEAVQENSRLFGDGEVIDTNRESWVRWDGAHWAVDTRPSEGWSEYQLFPARARGSFGSPTPEFVAGLPDGPEELRAYLDGTVSGSNSHDEALFVAVTDLALSHLLDPATFAVALKAIADVDGVRTREVQVDGREAIEISYRRFFVDALGVESFTVDPATAQVLREESSDPSGTYSMTTTLLETVEEVPAEVLADFEEHDGERVCADGDLASYDVDDGDC